MNCDERPPPKGPPLPFPIISTWATKGSRKLPISSNLRLQQKPPRLASRCALPVVRRLIRQRAQSWLNWSNGSMLRRASSVQILYQSAGCLASVRTV